jgi:hypothetical protein
MQHTILHKSHVHNHMSKLQHVRYLCTALPKKTSHAHTWNNNTSQIFKPVLQLLRYASGLASQSVPYGNSYQRTMCWAACLFRFCFLVKLEPQTWQQKTFCPEWTTACVLWWPHSTKLFTTDVAHVVSNLHELLYEFSRCFSETPYRL